MKKKSVKYATFGRLFSISLSAVALSGCLFSREIPEERYIRADLFVDQGAEELRQMHFEEAKRFFELAADLAPLAAAKDGLGCVELLRGDVDKAVSLFEEAYQMDRTYDEAMLNLALAYEVRGDSDRARDIYLEYLNKYPDSAPARNNLAALEYERGGGRIEVLHALTKAAMLAPNRVLSQNIVVLRRSEEN